MGGAAADPRRVALGLIRFNFSAGGVGDQIYRPAKPRPPFTSPALT